MDKLNREKTENKQTLRIPKKKRIFASVLRNA